MIRTGLRLLPVVFATALMSPLALADDINPKDLLNLSLEQLSNVEVTSVSKTAEKESEAAAAIYVITQEDIKNSGATSIPELLRGVPGVVVTQSGSHDWTVAARGFNDQFSNKLLVLIDGRTVYSPLFSGVVWDQQDTVLSDIDRIEVIRGPGATLWGANAVNGVINIITKNAKDTQGGLAEASAGNQIKSIDDARYGVKIGDDSYVRTYAKFSDYDSEERPGGGSAGDGWEKRQAGFRSDSKLTSEDTLTVQGDAYRLDADTPHTFPDLNSFTLSNMSDHDTGTGGNLLARWVDTESKESQTSLQVYFDNVYRRLLYFNDNTNTADLDFQHTWTGWSRQEIVWGAGYRFINDRNTPTQQFFLDPSNKDDNLFNTFVQDKITLDPKDVFLTLGSKLEYNDYSHFEVQPSARLSWLPTDNQTVWGSLSRAVHTPSRFTYDGDINLAALPPTATPFNPTTPAVVMEVPNRKLNSEDLVAYELGYRIEPTKTTSIDISTFYNDYHNLFVGVNEGPIPGGGGAFVILPVSVANAGTAHSEGFELSTKWKVNSQWQLSGTYSYIDLQFDDKTVSTFYAAIDKQPKNMFSLQSTAVLPYHVSMTNTLYYTSDLTEVDVPGYYRFDTKLTYPITDKIDISLVGQNLLDKDHKEFGPFNFQQQTEIGRSIYGSVAFKF